MVTKDSSPFVEVSSKSDASEFVWSVDNVSSLGEGSVCFAVVTVDGLIGDDGCGDEKNLLRISLAGTSSSEIGSM